MAVPFDQEKALRILEPFAEGKFEEIMNYSFTNMWSFANTALDYISATADRNKFLAKMLDTFAKEGVNEA